jgi:CRP-like cAMP-binding protein
MPTRKPVLPVDCPACAIRDACALNRIRQQEPARGELPLRERIFHRGDKLLEEGTVAKVVRVVKLGTVFGYRRGLDGRSRPIGVASRGSGLGIFGTFGMPSQATCVALTTTRVCELPVIHLRDAHPCSAGLVAQVGRSVTEAFSALTAWSEAMRLPGTLNQLAYVLVLLAEAGRAPVVQLPSHAALGELLGARRETIARALRSLEREGCIRRHERKRFDVHRERLLARLVRAPHRARAAEASARSGPRRRHGAIRHFPGE